MPHFTTCRKAWLLKANTGADAGRKGLLLIRGIFGFGAIINYFFAVQFLPLSEALVLTFTAPIWAAVLGPFVIKETPQR